MVEVIPKHIKDIWDSWNIRGLIILSLSLQTILIFVAPFRKRTPNKFMILLLWCSYLLADLSANFAVALIAKNQGKDPKPNNPPQDKKLVALWAPFLLLHLGGPDTITAFSLEDNALWNRHFLGFVFQALAGVYVVVQSLPNVLWGIIVLLFMAGTLKYLERTIALYLASSDKFRGSTVQTSISMFDFMEMPNNLDIDSILASERYRKERPGQLNIPGIDPVRAFEMFIKKQRGQLKHRKQIHPCRTLTHLEILQYAFLFFNNFKSLMVNNIFSLEMRNTSRAFFTALRNEEALWLIQTELDFIYEGLYTKGAVLHSWVGVVSRFISLGSLLSAFGIFHYRHNKFQDFHSADIVITYTLFVVGIALDVISIHMFMASDWTTAVLTKLKDDPNDKYSWKDKVFNWMLSLKRSNWTRQTLCGEYQEEVLNTPFLLRKWTGSIKMFNFVTYSMIADTQRKKNPRGRTRQLVWNATLSPFNDAVSMIQTWSENIVIWFCDLHQYIIHHVIILSQGENQVARSAITIVKTLIEICFYVPYFSVLLVNCLINLLGIKDRLHEIRLVNYVHSEPLTENLWSFIFSKLKIKSHILDSLKNTTTRSSTRRYWASSHTQIQIPDHEMLARYITDVDYDHSLLIWHIATELCYQEEDSAEENCGKSEYPTNCKISRILSDYMMYLLIMQPRLMSEVAGIGKIRFRDTLAEANELYKKTGIKSSRNVKLASKIILSVDTSIEPRDVKGNHSKSVLFEASSLAKELQRLEKDNGEDKWETLSKVWLEFLFHAASHSDGTTRMELLSKGGEFINFVWLLKAHFGLVD